MGTLPTKTIRLLINFIILLRTEFPNHNMENFLDLFKTFPSEVNHFAKPTANANCSENSLFDMEKFSIRLGNAILLYLTLPEIKPKISKQFSG